MYIQNSRNYDQAPVILTVACFPESVKRSCEPCLSMKSVALSSQASRENGALTVVVLSILIGAAS